MKMFFVHIKQKLSDNFELNVYVFVSKKEKHVHIAFRIPLSDYDYFDKVIDLISNEWKRHKIFFNNYEMIYPRLILSTKSKFDYAFLEKEGGKRKLVNDVFVDNSEKTL